ncbi:MAG: restriction endonuclease subunit S [Burkholderiales bacterium]|jgi:type I restriction enzyme S subunit|nr:restriction endonuclease subunit S [Burkholderiales bacterium]
MHESWHVQLLCKIAEPRRGITYSSEMLESEAEGLPYINMKSFRKGGGFNPEGTKRYVGIYTPNDLIGERDLLVANTDVTAGDIVGAPALLPQELKTVKALYSHHVTRLRLNTDVTDTFLYYLLCLPEYRSHMLRIARGTTVLMLDMQAIKRIPIRAPKSNTEQDRIAEILTTLDKTIEQTEALIAKHQQIKVGLMHDLFTRGVTPDGCLRPTQDEAPQLYKKSPLGWIPREWQPKQVHEIGKVKGGKRVPAGTPFADEITPFSYLRVTDMVDGTIDDSALVHVDSRTEKLISAYKIFRNDIYVTIAGTLGEFGRIPEHLSGSQLTENAARITDIDTSVVDLDYLCAALRSDLLTKQKYAAIGVGAGVPKLALYQIERFWIPIAEIPEQQRIREMFLAAQETINAEKVHLDKLRQEKNGLMHDLLTGRVRVNAT